MQYLLDSFFYFLHKWEMVFIETEWGEMYLDSTFLGNITN